MKRLILQHLHIRKAHLPWLILSFLLLAPNFHLLADDIYLESSDPVHMAAGVSDDTITVKFQFNYPVDHENMYWDQFMLYPWGPYTKYTLHDRFFSEDSTTAYAVISHAPDTDYVWTIMELPGRDSIRMMQNTQILNYTTRSDISNLTLSGQLSYEPIEFDNPSARKQTIVADDESLFWGNAIVSLLDDISWLGEPEGFMGSLPHIVNVGIANPLTGEYLIENVRPGDYYLSAINFEPVKGEDIDPHLGFLGMDWDGSPPLAITIGEESVSGKDIVLYDTLPDVQPDFDGDIFVESSYPAHMSAGVPTDTITVRFSFNAAIDEDDMSWEQFMQFPFQRAVLHGRPWFAVNHMTAYAKMSHEPDTDYVWRIDDLMGLDGGYMESMQVINYTTRDEISELTISGTLTLSPELEGVFADNEESDFSWGMATLALLDDISWIDGPDGMMGSLPHHVNIGKVDPDTGTYLFENVRPGTYYLLAAHLEPVRDADHDPLLGFYGGDTPEAIIVENQSLDNKDIMLYEEWSMDAEDFSISEIPDALTLYQNYPNPFNPTTHIKYSLPGDSHVTLEVFDILGRKVMTLVNEIQAAGLYGVDFDATGLSSGMFIYRIQAENHIETKHMLFLK